MILKIFLMSLFCVGVYKSTEGGMIFDFVRRFLCKYITNEKILMPLITCIYCMASVWGSIAYILLSFILDYHMNAVEWLFCCVCCVPLNGYLWLLLDNADKKV